MAPVDLDTRVTELEKAVISLFASGGLCAPLPGPSRKQALNDEPPVADEHPASDKQLKKLIKKAGTAPGYYGADASADGVEEFGDVDGHPFHGNQYKGGGDDAPGAVGPRPALRGVGPRPGSGASRAALDAADKKGWTTKADRENVTLDERHLGTARGIVDAVEKHAGVSQAGARGHQELKDALAAGRPLTPKQVSGLKNYESYVRRQLGVSQVTGPAHDALLKALDKG